MFLLNGRLAHLLKIDMNSFIIILITCLLTFSQSCSTDGDCSNGQVCARISKWRLKHECKDPIYVGENEGCFREYKCNHGLVCKKKGFRSICQKPIIGALQQGASCDDDTECQNGLRCLLDQPRENSMIIFIRRSCKKSAFQKEEKAAPQKKPVFTVYSVNGIPVKNGKLVY